jgi:uncharacterized protein YeaO (DUF488 family)
MAVRIVQLGNKRAPNEGVRIGTVRRPPRGVPKSDYARQDFYDVWLPELAPSAALLGWYKSLPETPQNWERFMLRYQREMAQAPAVRILELLALLSRSVDFSAGCYCQDESRCHRSMLRTILEGHGASIASP